MKKLTTLLILLTMTINFSVYSQSKIFRGVLYDAIGYFQVKDANIYNTNTQKYAFTNQEGQFFISVSLNDTLIVSCPIYRQQLIIMDEANFNRGHNDFLLYHRAFLLKEVRVVAMNPTYDGFKRDILNTKLPDSYKNLNDVHLTVEERRNGAYKEGAPNVLNGTKLGSPITYLYNTFNKKMKIKQLYYEMQSYGDEVYQVPAKYNRDLVKEITGLEGAELMEFMVYCRFSYYDLVRWTREQIVASIRYKFDEYEYYKLLQEQE